MKKILFTLIFLMGMIILVMVSCKKKESSPDIPVDPWKVIITKTVGSAGGTLDAGSIKFTLPAGIFTKDYSLSIYSTTQTILGSGQISPSFKITGLPEEFEGILPISVKATGAIEDEFYLAAGVLQFARSYSDTVYALSYFPATDSAGYVQSAIKVVKPNKEVKKTGGYDPKLEYISHGTVIIVVSGSEDYYDSSNFHFHVVYSKPGVTLAQATMLGEALETSLVKYYSMGFDISKLSTKYPIPVTFRQFQGSPIPFWGDNVNEYGSYTTSALYLSPSYDFNVLKMSEIYGISTIAGHECFHMIQSLYNTGGELKNWLTEATATYVEELFYPSTDYLPNEFNSHMTRSFLGMEAGATWSDPSEGVGHASSFHGYGMADVIKYICNFDPGALKKMILDIDKDVHPVEAVLNAGSAIPGWNGPSVWAASFNALLMRQIYSKVSERAFIAGNFYTETPLGKTVTLDASQTEPVKVSYSMPDLSASLTRINLAGVFDASAELKISSQTTGDTSDLTYGLYYFIDRSMGLVLEGSPSCGTKLKDLKDAGYSILLLTTNKRHYEPYTSTTKVDLNIEKNNTVFFIGQHYGGGIIFCFDDATHQHGCIAAPNDQSSGATWGCKETELGGTDPQYGFGQANTLAIINRCSEAGIAARICNDLVLNGYSDWYLPSLGELIKMHEEKDVIGGFTDGRYWSSSEDGAYLARGYDFTTDWTEFLKEYMMYVRAIRHF